MTDRQISNEHVIVVGAGIAGIASAIRLAIKGYEVDVYEANSVPGGKLTEFTNSGFRFDAGPSLFTMPQYVDELFRLANKDPQDYFRYKKLDVVCQYFFEDSTILTAWSDPDKLAKEFELKTADTKQSIIRFLKKSSKIYTITHHVFLEKSLHKLSTYFTWSTIKSFLRFPDIDPFRTMNKANESDFQDSKTRRFFNRYATYNGSNPYSAPATLNIIPHLEQHFGAYFPENGMYSITSSLVRLAEELGVHFHYNAKVEEILLEDKKVKGIQMKDKSVYAPHVISNMDVWFTYNQLLKGVKKPDKILKQERSSSALIFYWGINKTFPLLDLHNIFFSEDYEKEFSAIWKHKTIYNDPTVYINITSKYCPTDAPIGTENWFVMINVPANIGQDWDVLIAEARNHIIEKLSRILKADIGSLIVSENVMDPRIIESNTFSYQGSIYGTSSNGKFAAFLRHPNFSSTIDGLYFVGGSVHPGGGIPLALLSAKIIDESFSTCK
ncbi:Phytoene desaturase, neurosporene or lycopene producing [Arcticibacter svalbardensis MN12-7]|uniref:Phytoene desaturase, neurosporene or lycopene producing n=1 Tax=Arcticibacter svalbardensis MN12-7 TaxID=1150600 RepID=R9GM94_9SPHI|nr:1-hydroxycarotenoid 3,4-desaturase CrtD [Arcticibacter svalbardensis]EOR92853.1 Phytoene desaturase, neurosporene or lycopene producing [Arcticibacter svalbardensis MN12-7]